MKKTVFLKSTLRQFARSGFILLLVGVISFAFVSRVGETILIKQETDQLSGYYRSIGVLSSEDGGWGISNMVAKYLENAPYVAYTDRRLATSGVLQGGLYNTNTDGMYSSLIQFGYAAEINPADVFFYGTYIAGSSRRYEFTVDEVLSGYPEYVTPGKSIYLYVDNEIFGDTYTQLKAGERYLLRGYYDYTKKIIWKTLTSDLPWFLSAETNIDLSLPEYAQLVSEMKQSHDNACSLFITATVDMSAMPQFQPTYIGPINDRYYLVDGRWLNYEDHLSESRVIVVHEYFAKNRGLSIGDTVTLELRNINIDANIDAFRCFQTKLRPIGEEKIEPNQIETFEIVGTYNFTLDGCNTPNSGNLSNQYVYIPLSVFPESFSLTIPDDNPNSCSLVLASPADEETFLRVTRRDLARMGYTITFPENGYQNFKNATEGIDTAARSNVIIFAVILAVCFCLAVFVYFRFRRKDLAISRALGVPVGQCVIGSVLPLVLVGGIGIVAGSALAWRYTQGNAEVLLSTLVKAAKAEEATATLPMNTLVILCLVLIAALLALALIFATVTVKKPVLSQLQGGRNRK